MPEQILLFRHGPDPVGIDLAAVREVVRMLLPSPLPGAPAGVLGVVNLRGETVPVIDLEARLPAGAGRPGIDHHIVVSAAGEGHVAIVVSRVEEIESVPADCFRSARGVLPEGVPLQGIARLGERLVPILDPSLLLTRSEAMTLHEALERLRQVDP